MASIRLVPDKAFAKYFKELVNKETKINNEKKNQGELKRASSNCGQFLGHCFIFCGATAQLGPRSPHS
jgi:hypothetical protein